MNVAEYDQLMTSMTHIGGAMELRAVDLLAGGDPPSDDDLRILLAQVTAGMAALAAAICCLALEVA